MACSYIININGDKVTLLSDVPVGEIQSINDLERLLNEQSFDTLQELQKQISTISEIEQLDIDYINENSVGFYSPTDLLHALKTKADTKLLGALNIDQYKKSKIVVMGYGEESVPTQFYKDHIFLNLNYMYDYDNKIMALTELALYNMDKDNYEANSKFLRENINNIEAEDEINTLLRSLTTSKKESVITDLVNRIKLAYYKINIKIDTDIAGSNISVFRDSTARVWEKFGELNREDNFLPKSKVSVSSLKQGDLVLMPIEGTTVYNEGVYEIFYDSYVDIEGNTIIRSVVKGKNDEFETRKRIAKIKTYSGKIINSDVVNARILNNDIFNNYDYSKDDTKYVEIQTRFNIRGSYTGMWYYPSILNMLKNSEAKIIKDKEVHKIKQIQGSTITLEDGSTLNIKDVRKVAYPKNKVSTLGELKLEELQSLNSIWTASSEPDINEHIAFFATEKDIQNRKFSEGVVLGFGVRNNKQMVFYLTKTGLVKSIQKKNIKYISNPGIEYMVNEQEKADISLSLVHLYGKEDIIKTVIFKNKNSFRSSKYSVASINQYSFVSVKDILVDKASKSLYKIISVKPDVVKVSTQIGDMTKILIIKKEDLNNYLLFTKNPINESFAQSHITKNAYKLFYTPTDDSIEVKVYQLPNGFVFSLPIGQDVKTHSLYEPGVVDITQSMKNIIKVIYKLNETPAHIYNTYFEDATTHKKAVLKNREDTNFLKITNETLENILDSKTGLQNFIVPGSFITFKGNAKQFIVEKITKDSIHLGYYHYTDNINPDIQNEDIAYVKSEKFILDKEALNKVEVVGLHIPKWADVAFKELSELVYTEHTKESKMLPIDESDSIELVTQMANFIQNKYNVKIEFIHNKELQQFDKDFSNTAAFVSNNIIYINVDKASIAEPVHELLHLVLATMKHKDSATYYQLVNSIQNHPLFREVLNQYAEVNTEVLEETFIRLLSNTFRKNIIKDKIFTEETFNIAMTEAIKDLMQLTEDLSLEDPFDLLGKSTSEVLYEFGSSLIDNEESLINEESVNYMFDVAGKIQSLLDENKLKQKCS